MKKIIAVPLVLYICLSCGSKRQLAPLAPEDEFERAMYYYENKKIEDAILAFERILFYHPSSEYVDDAQYWLGMTYFENKEYDQAITEFDYLIRNFPTSAFLEQAHLNRAKAHLHKAPHYSKDPTEINRAIRLFDQFLTQFPNSAHTNEVRGLILEARNRLARKELENGKLYVRIGKEEAALLYFNYVVTTYPEADVSGEAAYQAAAIYEKRAQYEQALTLLRPLLEDESWNDKAEAKIRDIEVKVNDSPETDSDEKETNE
jgi:outer membrane protein assembly factor BamD